MARAGTLWLLAALSTVFIGQIASECPDDAEWVEFADNSLAFFVKHKDWPEDLYTVSQRRTASRENVSANEQHRTMTFTADRSQSIGIGIGDPDSDDMSCLAEDWRRVEKHSTHKRRRVACRWIEDDHRIKTIKKLLC